MKPERIPALLYLIDSSVTGCKFLKIIQEYRGVTEIKLFFNILQPAVLR